MSSKSMPREGHFDGEGDFVSYLNWARSKIQNFQGENWVEEGQMDIVQDIFDDCWELLSEMERDGFPPSPATAFQVFDRLRDCAKDKADWGWGMWRDPNQTIDLKDDDGNWVGYAPHLLVTSQLLKGAGIIQHIYSENPPCISLDLKKFEQEGVAGYMGWAEACELDAICSVPWMDPNLSSSDFANALLNGSLDRDKWQRVVNHDRIDDIRNFANTPGKVLMNPVVLYVDKNHESVTLTKTGKEGDEKYNLEVCFDFLKERQGYFHDYLPFPNETDLRPIWIIDGQHRTRGFGASARGSKIPIPFVIMIGDGSDEETSRSALVFTEINTKSEPIGDLHKIYLNYQFAMEGASSATDYSLDAAGEMTADSRPQRRAYELALHCASEIDSPLLNCIQFQDPPGRHAPHHLCTDSKKWTEVTRRWFTNNGIYADWATDEFNDHELLNFLIAFMNNSNQWPDGLLRWVTGRATNKSLFQFKGPFPALLRLFPHCVNSIINSGVTSRPIEVNEFEKILRPLTWVDWNRGGQFRNARLTGSSNTSVRHLLMWLQTAIDHGVQYDESETLNPDMKSLPGRGLLAIPDIRPITVTSANNWPALLPLELQVENPAHSFKVDWEIEATDANGDREIAVPSSWTAQNGNFWSLTIESNNIGATTSRIRVRANFSNGIGKSMTSWSEFEEPQ